MHADEFFIDTALIQKLLQEQFPHLAHLSLQPVPSNGTDNALYKLGDDLVIRLPKIHWAIANIDKEVIWLPKIAPFLPISIPTPKAKGSASQEYPYPWAIYNWIEGTNPTNISESFVNGLVSFLQALHAINLPNAPLCTRSYSLQDKDTETRAAIQELQGMIDTTAAIQLWERALEAPLYSKPPVWVHGDLSPSNLLISQGNLSGVIDFGSVGIGDPALDLIIAWNLLPLKMRYLFKSKLNVDAATWERGRGFALSIALIQLPYYKETNKPLAANAQHVLKQLTQEFYFASATSSQRALLHAWFEQEHIKKWMHGKGLQSTLQGLERFFAGSSSTTYWICYDEDIPFAFLITAPYGENGISLDIFICDTSYLGKGLSIPMIQTFLIRHFPHVDKVFIDPEATNVRAIYVYQKIGFTITHEFIASWHPVPHYQMSLSMENLLHPFKNKN